MLIHSADVHKYRSIAVNNLELLVRKFNNALSSLENMRGRWASAAIGAGMARRSAGRQMDQQSQAHEAEMKQAQQQIDAQQRQLEAMQQQKQQSPQPQQEDLTQKLKKYGDLKQQGLITEEEFQKLKADLLSKM
jgi:Short C-terminal domain